MKTILIVASPIVPRNLSLWKAQSCYNDTENETDSLRTETDIFNECKMARHWSFLGHFTLTPSNQSMQMWC